MNYPLIILQLKKIIASLTIVLNLLVAQSSRTLPTGNLGAATVTTGNSYPTSSYSFSDNDIINAGDLNNITTWVGLRNSTDTTSLSYAAFNPSLPSSTGSLSTLASTTGQIPVNKGGTATTTFISGLVFASGTNAFTTVTPTQDGQIPIASGSTWVAAEISAGSGVTLATSTGSITLTAATKFGGTGSDGALSITSGTTTVNCLAALYCAVNYSTLSLTGTAALKFTNPNANGTIVYLFVSGNATINTSSTPAIDVRLMGAPGGTGGNSNTNGASTGWQGGGGGASEISAGGNGTRTSALSKNAIGLNGTGFTEPNYDATFTGGVGSFAVGAATAAMQGSSSIYYFLNNIQKYRRFYVLPGTGGGGGSGGDANCGGNCIGNTGGTGGGGLWMEVGGNLNFPAGQIIDSSGQTPADNNTSTTGAGGGGGGSAVLAYTTLVSASGTLNTAGGLGTIDAAAGGNGAAGASSTFKNVAF